MKHEEIISLLNEAIGVLEEFDGRKLSRGKRDTIHDVCSLCVDPKRQQRLLGSRWMDFSFRVGYARRGIDQEFPLSDYRNFRMLLRSLRQSIVEEELHTTDAFLALANAGCFAEPFVHLSL